MSVIQLGLPWEPDKGPLSGSSIDFVMNMIPDPEGWMPTFDLTPYSQALPSECKGAWWFRSDAGTFNTIAATQTAIYRLDSSSLGWVECSRLGANTSANGTFAADASWTKGTGVTISGGVCNFTSVADGQGVSQPQTLVAGTKYQITYSVSGRSAGGVQAALTGGTTVAGATHSANGTYTDILTAVTGNTTFAIIGTGGPTTLAIDNVLVQKLGGYTGPDDGELWTAAVFGPNFYVSNINDPLQVTPTGSAGNFVDAPGNPPQAKFVTTIGDFLFLANLKSGATRYPRKWQHCKVNDPTNWVIDGGAGSSDDQEIPDGDDIVGIIPMAGANARIIQKRARRALTFTPGSFTAFSQSDIDAVRGSIAPGSIVPLGSNQYFFLTDNGFFINDEYRPIGAERVDRTFFKTVDPKRLYAVKAATDIGRKIVWVSWQDAQGQRHTWAYHWYQDRWFQTDEKVVIFVISVSPGYVLDDLPLVLDAYPTPPLDSPYWAGGKVSFGAFKDDGRLHLFGGDRSEASIETTTMQLTEGTGAFVWGAEVLGNMDNFTVQHGTTFLPSGVIEWSAERTQSRITGVAPFCKDGRWHRFRVNVAGGGYWTHLHGVRPYAKPSGQA